jgi:hypothetical protein
MHRDLVERAMAGDREAFTELTRRSIGRLYAIARLILRDDGRAEADLLELRPVPLPPGVPPPSTRVSDGRAE